MRKIVYIALFLIGIAAVSCNKQEIVPVSTDLKSAPVWETFEDTKPVNGRSSIGGDDIIDDGTDDTGITDPNDDPDGETPSGDQNEKP